MEIWIGDDRGQMATFLDQNAGDWFNLLNQGIIKPGVADSDTHNRILNVSGLPHNMVASSTDDPGLLSADADTISANVNAGHSIGTNGPMVRVSANAVSTGQTASLDLGDPLTIATTDGAADITVTVQSPTWAQFDTIEFYVNSTTTRTMSNKETGNGPVSVKRYAITPDFVQTRRPTSQVNTVRCRARRRAAWRRRRRCLSSGLTQDAWGRDVKGTTACRVRSTYHAQQPEDDGQHDPGANSPTATSGENVITALAFTNPLIIDVDGLGGWTPPGVQIRPVIPAGGAHESIVRATRSRVTRPEPARQGVVVGVLCVGGGRSRTPTPPRNTLVVLLLVAWPALADEDPHQLPAIDDPVAGGRLDQRRHPGRRLSGLLAVVVEVRRQAESQGEVAALAEALLDLGADGDAEPSLGPLMARNTAEAPRCSQPNISCRSTATYAGTPAPPSALRMDRPEAATTA
jgi:hypothetical protein